MKEPQIITSPFEPVYDSRSRVLILGSFPSVKSREQQFYYGHPQNRFWRMLAAVLKEHVPVTIPEKKKLLLTHSVALWDVIDTCSIVGSADSSIRDVIPSDIGRILRGADIAVIYGNGATACGLYERYVYPKTGRPITRMPSTSPANAACSLEQLITQWSVIRNYII